MVDMQPYQDVPRLQNCLWTRTTACGPSSIILRWLQPVLHTQSLPELNSSKVKSVPALASSTPYQDPAYRHSYTMAQYTTTRKLDKEEWALIRSSCLAKATAHLEAFSVHRNDHIHRLYFSFTLISSNNGNSYSEEPDNQERRICIVFHRRSSGSSASQEVPRWQVFASNHETTSLSLKT